MKPYPEELKERARELYRPGEYGYKQVARDLGVPLATVVRWCNPEYAERDRAACRDRKLNYRGVCVDCGGETSYSGTSVYGSERCAECYKKIRATDHGSSHMYRNRGCRCEECRVGESERRRAMKQGRVPSHGASGYFNYGCRCDVCRAAGSEANRRAAELRKARQAAA